MLRALICLWIFAASVPVVAGAQDTPPIPVAKISLPDPAYLGMPIWMQVDSSTKYTIHYPASTTPNDFYCNEVDVKKGSNGQRGQENSFLPTRYLKSGQAVFAGVK